MKAEDQRIAIAGACGWRLEWQGAFAEKDTERELLHMLRPDGTIEIAGFFRREEYPQLRQGMANYVPNFTASLDAMHEAEKVLDWKQREEFARNLYQVVPDCFIQSYDGINEYDEYWPLIHATAAQRAEAFLRTLDLWKE